MSADQVSRQALAVVLAGGQGSRLGLLTRARCKPALPFGGRCRSIDFTLSNCVNSGVTRIAVATQYHAQSLIQHIQESFGFLNRERGEFIEIWSAEQREQPRSYAGTADAVFQNLTALDRCKPRYVVVLAADHVYRMDYSGLLSFHRESRAGLTIACQPVPAEQARHFGVMTVDRDEVKVFREKPAVVAGSSDVLASMGVYVFDSDLLRTLLRDDAARADSAHDFGRDVIPACVRSPHIRVCAHRLRDPCTGGPGYWRDIGTIDAYWSANMELLTGSGGIDLYDPDWPIWSAPDRFPPTRIPLEPLGRSTVVSQTVVANGCRLEGATVKRSILFNGVHVGTGSVVEDSVLLPGARVGARCRLRRVVIDEGVQVACGTSLGGDAIAPAGCCCEVSAGGVTVVSGPAAVRRPAEARVNGQKKRLATARDALVA
jgi:glucose-1-phosphate adenylyltransferase